MGLFSSIKKEFRRAGRSIKSELAREVKDVTKAGSLGFLDIQKIEQSISKKKRLEKEAREAAEKIQKKQRQSSLLREAELTGELALRKRSTGKGGRLGILTRSGEAGSLLV